MIDCSTKRYNCLMVASVSAEAFQRNRISIYTLAAWKMPIGGWSHWWWRTDGTRGKAQCVILADSCVICGNGVATAVATYAPSPSAVTLPHGQLPLTHTHISLLCWCGCSPADDGDIGSLKLGIPLIVPTPQNMQCAVRPIFCFGFVPQDFAKCFWFCATVKWLTARCVTEDEIHVRNKHTSL